MNKKVPEGSWGSGWIEKNSPVLRFCHSKLYGGSPPETDVLISAKSPKHDAADIIWLEIKISLAPLTTIVESHAQPFPSTISTKLFIIIYVLNDVFHVF